MASFTITKIDFANTAIGTQTFRFEYKLWSAPDSAYALIGTSTVNTAGTLTTPQVVTGLTPCTLYYIRSSNNCNSPREYYVQSLSTNGNVTTFWNIYPTDTFDFVSSSGMTVINYTTCYRMTSAPIDITNYITAYLWIVNKTSSAIVYGSTITPYANAPNWSSFIGNPGAAIIDWLTTAMQIITGDTSASYQDIYDEIAFTYSVAAAPSGDWPGQNGRPSFIAAGAYNFGLLLLPTNIQYGIYIKFAKTVTGSC